MIVHKKIGMLVCVLFAASGICRGDEPRLERISYNNPGLVVDLGVGLWAWPLPMDYDRDGDLDLVVSCPDVPYRGTYFFENPGEGEGSSAEGQGAMPVFKPAVRIADRMPNVQVSYVGDEPVVTAPGKIFVDFRSNHYESVIELPLPQKIDPQYERYRANQWKLVDWEADGDQDLVIGIGVWDDYGWDDAWDAEGNWTNGPLHGFVYLVENVAISEPDAASVRVAGTPLAEDQPWPEYLGPRPVFAEPVKIEAGGESVDVYGMPSPNLADFDGDGDLDLVCGEFLDGFTIFENVSESSVPGFIAGQRLSPRMDLQMITPIAIDWDNDGAMDIVCGDEDGRVALIRNQRLDDEGTIDSDANAFAPPAYFRQKAADIKFGALVTPVSVDWDDDGDEDIVCGNTAGYIGFIENVGGEAIPMWEAPKRVRRRWWLGPSKTLDQAVREQARERGSIQGPCEAKWGYSTLSVADWNHDGHRDLVANGIWGRVHCWMGLQSWKGPPTSSSLGVDWEDAPAKPDWTWWDPEPGELVTQWRTTPCVLDWNNDDVNDLVMLDHEGYLAFFKREQRGEELVLLPPERIFKIEGPCEFDSRHRPVGDKKDDLLRLNANRAGASGRRKLHFVDWDGDGRLDLLVNSVNVNFLRNVRTDEEGFTWFRDEGPMDERVLAGHTTSPTTVDWDKNGIPDLLVGAEDGFLYYKPNPRAAGIE